MNPKGTSALAFDGSGKVLRNAKKDLCTFQTGKVYHADLNASYNIGARYHISCILKPLPETVRLQLQAKVPDAAGRTSQALPSLIRLHEAVSCTAYDASAPCIQDRETSTILTG